MSKIKSNMKYEKSYQQNPTHLWLTDSHRYRIVSIAIITLICIVISLFYLFFYLQIGEIYTNETRSSIVELKKTFLKNTVDNLIQELETARSIEANHYKDVVDQRYEVYSARSLVCDDYMQNIITDFRQGSHVPKWTAFVWEDSDTILYDPAGYFEHDIASTIEKIKPLMSHYRIIRYKNASCLFGFSKEYVEDTIKTAMTTKIKKLSFENDSYIWVNEILNYNGGKDYAIRRIHPNLPETEGMHLSTDMEDIKGNHPYLTELEGIKKDGELFFSYYFKELNSDNISEKLTYAKLYKEYDWVIAMGVQNNELEEYIYQTSKASKTMALSKMIELFVILLIVVISCLTLVFLIERWRLKHSKIQLEVEFQFDPLTNAKSRRFGTNYLQEAFRVFQLDEPKHSIAVMLFDIDNFKNINDCYGHSEGDRILKEIVPAVYKSIRSSDELFRWGGDEFVGVFRVANEESTVCIMEKILEAVSSLRLKTSNGANSLSITISIGVSHFKDDDTDYSDALNRADKAMYLSKADGGGRVKQL